MEELFTAKNIAWAIENCPPQLVAVIIIAVLVAWLTYKVNAVVSGALNQEHEQTKRIMILEKQQHKIEQTVCSMPCVPRRTVNWLADYSQNGGQPPEEPFCQFAENKRAKD